MDTEKPNIIRLSETFQVTPATGELGCGSAGSLPVWESTTQLRPMRHLLHSPHPSLSLFSLAFLLPIPHDFNLSRFLVFFPESHSCFLAVLVLQCQGWLTNSSSLGAS